MPPAFSAFAYGSGASKAAEAVARRGAVSAAAAAAAAAATTPTIGGATPPPPTGAATPARTRSRTCALSTEPTPVRSSASLRFADEEDDDDLATTTKRPRTLAPKPPPSSSSAATTSPRLAPKLGNGAPMRLIILGHNPSDTAWATRHYYGHGSNKMWPLLQRVGISPPGTPSGPADDLLPSTAGVGFIDVGTGHPGTHSSSFSSDDFARWRPVFYARLKAHVARASASVGVGQGQRCSCGRCGAPLAVAFAGKRQFQELLALPPMTEQEEARVEGELRVEAEREIEAAAGGGGGGGGGEAAATAPTPTTKKHSKSKRKAAAAAAKKKNNRLPPVELGLQTVLPQGWPLPPSTQVWVVATTSGAAGLTNEAREQSWRAMWQEVGREPWPRRVVAGCDGGGGGGGGGAKEEA